MTFPSQLHFRASNALLKMLTTTQTDGTNALVPSFTATTRLCHSHTTHSAD